MLAIGIALWQYFGFSNQSSWTEQAIVFEDTSLQLPPEIAGATGRIRLVHFWDPACSGCNRETGAHLSYLISMYRREKIDFFSVQKPHTQGDLPLFLREKLVPLEKLDGMENIPASPFVAIWDRNGKLAYAGPYSLGMVCTSANSFVEPLLDKLLRGEEVEPSGILAVGCYCSWQ
ncbi:thiol-disulfide isomerase [Lampropedia puyangensis]|uniref:Thiol-disulfide isomerase n=1 Tax=Lampropedia puyangensis TaxID=1330072 RepID=A0A4S8ESG7_9BURK|nr:DUF6436 domain-containing protein [Lampropedia puyangensis]THT97819.1 thiol-disulfide isomerase [Lampropedia puyangensis]